MNSSDFSLFDTAIGRCGIAWNDRGVIGVQLPEAGGEAGTRARVLRRFPEAREAAPPPEVQQAVDSIVALLHGEAGDPSPVALHMAGAPAFNPPGYQVGPRIPPGPTPP